MNLPVKIKQVWPELGTRNCLRNKCAVHITRSEHRQYRRGPNQRNVDVVMLKPRSIPAARGELVFEQGAVEFYTPTYPPMGMAMRMLERGWLSVALSNRVALTTTGNVYFKRWVVGTYDGEAFTPAKSTPETVTDECKKVLGILE